MHSKMSRQIRRKEFKQIIELPELKVIPVRFTFSQYLQPMELFVLDPGDNLEKPKQIQLSDIYQCQSGLYCRKAFTDAHEQRRFESDVPIITLRIAYAN
jgi:hypothetical protein